MFLCQYKNKMFLSDSVAHSDLLDAIICYRGFDTPKVISDSEKCISNGSSSKELTEIKTIFDLFKSGIIRFKSSGIIKSEFWNGLSLDNESRNAVRSDIIFRLGRPVLNTCKGKFPDTFIRFTNDEIEFGLVNAFTDEEIYSETLRMICFDEEYEKIKEELCKCVNASINAIA